MSLDPLEKRLAILEAMPSLLVPSRLLSGDPALLVLRVLGVLSCLVDEGVALFSPCKLEDLGLTAIAENDDSEGETSDGVVGD